MVGASRGKGSSERRRGTAYTVVCASISNARTLVLLQRLGGLYGIVLRHSLVRRRVRSRGSVDVTGQHTISLHVGLQNGLVRRKRDGRVQFELFHEADGRVVNVPVGDTDNAKASVQIAVGCLVRGYGYVAHGRIGMVQVWFLVQCGKGGNGALAGAAPRCVPLHGNNRGSRRSSGVMAVGATPNGLFQLGNAGHFLNVTGFLLLMKLLLVSLLLVLLLEDSVAQSIGKAPSSVGNRTSSTAASTGRRLQRRRVLRDGMMPIREARCR